MALSPQYRALVLIGVFVVLTLAWREFSLKPDGQLHVQFFSIGQGDSAMITTPSGRTIVIDGGPDWSTLERLGETMPFFDRHIDLLLVSHPNLDHLASFPEILKRYSVSALGTTEISSALPKYNQLFALAQKNHVQLMRIAAGKTIDLGDGAMLAVLWPPAVMPPGFTKNANNTSEVLRLEYKGHRALFTGDLEKTAETTLVTAHADLKADILKVGHHGSNTSSSTGFLLAVDPKLAVISVGENSYGHPRSEIVSRLKNLGIEVKRTDRDGTVEVVW